MKKGTQKCNKQKNLKSGFTLLELLVVVLIIGILASIALPQYKKAVLRSKFATIKEMTHAIYQAQQRYFLVHDNYTTEWEALDIDIPGADCNITDASIFCNLRNTTNNTNLQYVLHKKTGKARCDASPGATNNLANQICQMETGKTEPDSCEDNNLFCRYYY